MSLSRGIMEMGLRPLAQTVQSKLNLNSSYVRIMEEGCFLEVVRPVKLGRKEGPLLLGEAEGGRGRPAHVGKWPELLERIVEEMKGEI